MLNHTTAEIHRDLYALLLDQFVAERAKTDIWCAKRVAKTHDSLGHPRTLTQENSLHNSGMVEDIKDACAAWITAVQARDATWLNAHANYNSVMLEAINLKHLALGKVELWHDNPKASAGLVKRLSLRATDQQAQSRKQHLLQEAKAATCVNTCRPSVVTWWCGPRASNSETVKKLALQLCADQGLLVALVDNTSGETSLMRQAAFGAAPAAILLLVDAGADLRALDLQGATGVRG